jgi:hypothetical protein
MGERPRYGYGTPNWEMIGRWLELEPEDDGPFWALNLMKYKPVADYGDGQSSGRSGREADDAYAPLGPLAEIGAVVAFHGDVVDQPVGQPAWDRIGIVRYPTRAAFFAMQQRDDFKRQHVHKEAGMEFTIVMSCLPTQHWEVDPAGSLVMVLERGDASPAWPDGLRPAAAFDVEGVIVGDERRWDRARFAWADAEVRVDLAARAAEVDEMVLAVVDPALDRLVESVVSAPAEAERGSV